MPDFRVIEKETILAVGGLLLACCIMIVLSMHGSSGRFYVIPPRIEIIPDPPMAFLAWKKWGVKGRILLLFDRHLNMEAPERQDQEISVDGIPLDSYLRKDNYVYLAIRNSIVRKVYHVIPDAAWPEVENVLAGNRYVSRSGGMFTMTVMQTPIFIMRLRDVPLIREPALLVINVNYWNEGDLRRIIARMKDRAFRSDFITLSGHISDERVHEFQSNAFAAE